MRRAILSVFMAVALAGCTVDLANYKYTPLGSEPVAIGTAFKVTPSEPWFRVTSDLDEENKIYWSPGKNPRASLGFWYDLEDGDALYNYVDPDFPLFRSNMTSSDVMELFRQSIEFRDVPDSETSDLRSAAFGQVSGFRFEYLFLQPDGSPVRGTVLGAVVGKRLQLISYAVNPASDFEKFLDDANRVMESVQLQ